MVARCKDRPHNVLIDRVADHIRKTGRPETCDDLFQGPIPRDAEYQIIRRVGIDGKKRPDGDMAPCPMCTPNRFLDGRLVWFPRLQCVSVIGRCCAVNADKAEREYNRQESKRREEDFLLAALPVLKRKRAVLAALRPPAEEATRLFRRIRRMTPSIHAHLRTIKERQNARFRVVEILRSEEDEDASDYFGPAGFRGRGDFGAESRDHDLGPLQGTTATMKDYRPLKELDDASRMADLFPFDGSQEDALNLVASMTDAERKASVANLELLERQYTKLIKRLRDFAAFFAPSNIQRLHHYGTHALSHFAMEARYGVTGGRPIVSLRHENEECRMVIGSQLFATEMVWPSVALEKT